MIAAKITCLCRQIRLPSLDLDLRQGDAEWVSEESARDSRELRQYERQGALKVEYLEKVVDMGSGTTYPQRWQQGNRVLPNRAGLPEPPPSRALGPTKKAEAPAPAPVQAPTPASAPAPVPAEMLTLMKNQAKMQSALLEELRNLRLVCEGLRGAISALAAHQKNLPASMLGAVQTLTATMLRQSQQGMAMIGGAPPVATSVETEDRADDHPVFIPSGLVDNSKAVSVASQESATEALESSAAQLRALKGATRKDEE